jgi:3-oxoadipate enol-lactonase
MGDSCGCSIRVAVEPGVALSVEVSGVKDKPSLVLSNSIGASRGMWDELVERLNPFARIVRYDTRGHGRSDVPIRPLTLERLGRDVLKIMDNLKIEKAAFCGISLGGLTGMWLGANASDRFTGLVLANAAPNFPPPSLWKERAASVRTSGMAPLVKPTLDRWFTKRFQETAPARVAEIEQMFRSTTTEGYAACCEVLADADMAPQIGRIACPVRVIAGEHDPSTPPSRGAEIIAAIARAEMITLDAAHISSVEAADAFAISVREFISHL